MSARAKLADLLLFGDDRLVPLEQEEWIRLLKAWGIGKAISVLVTDRFCIRDQKTIDLFLAGKKPLESILKRLNLSTGSTHGSESGYAEVLRWAKRSRVRIVAVASRRDRPVSYEKLNRSVQRARAEGFGKVVAWIGASRLRDRELQRAISKDEGALAIQLEPMEFGLNVRAATPFARLRPNLYADLRLSPFLSLEYFRRWEEGKEDLLHPSEVIPFFRRAVKVISNRMGVKAPAAPKKILNLYGDRPTHFDIPRNLPKSIAGFVMERIKKGESAVIPSASMVLIAALDRGEIAEEAAHYCRLAGANHFHHGPKRTFVEEAFAFMASLWFDPSRKIPVGDKKTASSWEVIHLLGYQLGDRLFEQWKASHRKRELIRRLWREPIETEVDSLRVLFELRKAEG